MLQAEMRPDGREINREDYSRLYETLKLLFNDGEIKSEDNNFELPDLSGRFFYMED